MNVAWARFAILFAMAWLGGCAAETDLDAYSGLGADADALLASGERLPVVSLDDWGSDALGIEGREIWYHGDAFIDDAGIRRFEISFRDARHALPKAAALIVRLSPSVDSCSTALPGRRETNGVVLGRRCRVEARQVAIRFDGVADEQFVEYPMAATESGLISVPTEATGLELYVRDTVVIETNCRTTYSGTYPTTTCSGAEPPRDVYVSRGYNDNYRLDIASE